MYYLVSNIVSGSPPIFKDPFWQTKRLESRVSRGTASATARELANEFGQQVTKIRSASQSDSPSKTTMSNFLFHPCPKSCKNDIEQNPTKPTGQRLTTKTPYERQQRYREKQRRYVDHLEDSVKRLRMDVDQQLIAHSNVQNARVQDLILGIPARPNASDIASMMRECMKAFLESGIQDQQALFLKSVMCSDVRFGDQRGPDRILEQWTHFVLYFNDAAPMLENCKFSVDFLQQDVTVGHVSALLVVRLTCRSLATIFPHTASSKRLRDQLLQNPLLRLPMSVFFQFDDHGKVCLYDPTIDFVTGLYSVLQDYRDVASMLESANIDASGQIGGDLPSSATSQLRVSSRCDRCSHNRAELEPRRLRSSARLDKLSLDFLLSSGESTH